ncbi:3,4-dihydroxyphenylacetate 2,3-dioxygenase [Paramicrobacterium agarici]|uniref:3,4-dihydroxyphenylacetate 2,3-dioxygenase n=1 Tax=Paramicrobacterium agarici TaxID=630514 RepID=A0A2A9DX94_9MICO|nr:3,4-dihydroxyphenylacetate 2,3-dioxygenase [Microbacterium agarici]PFG30755.1 3,4-dihydroxyphenylacetate 2,3-dioxygenase [Microbacterium agarici]
MSKEPVVTSDAPEPVVTQGDPVPAPADPIPTPKAPAPDVLRCAYMELVVTDLEVSRNFYVDVLGLVVTEEDENTVYLRSLEEFIHHNLVLRKGDTAAVAAFSYRVRSPEDLDRAVAFYTELGCRVERRSEGFTKGIGDSVRVEDPLGFPYEFFYDVEHVERLAWRYDLYSPGALVRIDHFNQVTPDVPRAVKYMEDLGFRVTEDIQDDEGTTYAAWMRRKPTVHDTAMTGGAGPRMHHVAFATHEKHNIIAICDKLGALRMSDAIERGPGRHGVSNAFYLYLRDPDGHRVEIYTQDYYTGDPDNPRVTWDVHDNQRRDWWGNPVVPSWYTDASLVLDLDGNPQQVHEREEKSEMAVTIGADGFSYTRKGDDEKGFKLGNTL